MIGDGKCKSKCREGDRKGKRRGKKKGRGRKEWKKGEEERRKRKGKFCSWMVRMGGGGRKEKKTMLLYLANGHSEQQSPGGFIPRGEDGHRVDERYDPILNGRCTLAHQDCTANVDKLTAKHSKHQSLCNLTQDNLV